MGGAAVLHGEDLYRLRLGVLPFTYPPFAAVVLTALAAVPSGAAVVLLTGASVAALPATLYLALRLSRSGEPGPPGGGSAPAVALAAGAAAIWLDPARATLGYGQVDILLAAAVLYDLTLPGQLPAEGRGDRTGRGHQAHPGDLRGIPADDPALPGRCHRGRRVRRDDRGRVRGDPGEFGMVLGGRVRQPRTCQPGAGSGEPEPARCPVTDAAHRERAAAVAAAGRGGDDHRAGAGDRRRPPRRRRTRLQPVRGYRAARLADLVDSPLGHRHPGTASGRDGGLPRLASREGGGVPARCGRDRGGRGHRMDPAGAGNSRLGLAHHARGRCGVQRGLRPHRRTRHSPGRRVPAARHPQGARPAVRSS